MLMIRLKRVGRRNDPSFRVVVTDKRRGPKSNNYIENLGLYNPRSNVHELKPDRIEYWLGEGAQTSDTVHNLLIKEGIIKDKTRNPLPRKSPVAKRSEEEAKEVPTKEDDDAETSSDDQVDQISEDSSTDSTSSPQADAQDDLSKDGSEAQTAKESVSEEESEEESSPDADSDSAGEETAESQAPEESKSTEEKTQE